MSVEAGMNCGSHDENEFLSAWILFSASVLFEDEEEDVNTNGRV